MLKIYAERQRQQQAANAAAMGPKKKKVTAAQLRAQQDLNKLSLPPTMTINFPDPDDILHFILTIRPERSMYAGGTFHFDMRVNQNYPYDPPKVKCTQKIYHPNIDPEGNVCLNILRQEWYPTLDFDSIIMGLQLLFSEPNADDPLNKEAGQDLKLDPKGFETNVKISMRGGEIRGQSFERVL